MPEMEKEMEKEIEKEMEMEIEKEMENEMEKEPCEEADYALMTRKEKSRLRMREYARRKRKELVFVQDRMLQLYKELVRLGAYQGLSNESKEFFDVYIIREKTLKRPYPPTLYKMFGDDDVAPGVSCTLKDAMQRLYKGKNEINFLVRKWEAKHGVHISFEPDDSGFALDGLYVIKSIDPPAKVEVKDIREIMSKREQRDYRDYESVK